MKKIVTIRSYEYVFNVVNLVFNFKVFLLEKEHLIIMYRKKKI